jgi:hypothetical protein
MIVDTLANLGKGIPFLFLTIGLIGILLLLLKITFGEENICEDIDNHSADNSNTDFVVCKEDLDHHSKVFGTALKGVDTSPVGMVNRGIYPKSYLDQFSSESKFFESIQAYKATKE